MCREAYKRTNQGTLPDRESLGGEGAGPPSKQRRLWGLCSAMPWGHAHSGVHLSLFLSGFRSPSVPHTLSCQKRFVITARVMGNEVCLPSPFEEEHSTDV